MSRKTFRVASLTAVINRANCIAGRLAAAWSLINGRLRRWDFRVEYLRIYVLNFIFLLVKSVVFVVNVII